MHIAMHNLCEETISRTDEGQPRPKYIFNKCGTNIYFFTLQRFGPSPSLNFKYCYIIVYQVGGGVLDEREILMQLLKRNGAKRQEICQLLFKGEKTLCR